MYVYESVLEVYYYGYLLYHNTIFKNAYIHTYFKEYLKYFYPNDSLTESELPAGGLRNCMLNGQFSSVVSFELI